jgi:hypothetical protein
MGCQELVDCVRTGAMESCAKFAATCASQDSQKAESETLVHHGAKLEVYGNQGVYVGRGDGTVVVFHRGAESGKGAMLVVPASGAAYTVPDMVFVESSNGSSWWHSAQDDERYDGLSSTFCGTLFGCLKEGGCTSWARDCMHFAPRKTLCESGGTLVIEGQPATIPLQRCLFEGGSMTLGSDESSFYIVYTMFDGALGLLRVLREGARAPTDRQWVKLHYADGVYTMQTRAMPPALVPLIAHAPVAHFMASSVDPRSSVAVTVAPTVKSTVAPTFIPTGHAYAEEAVSAVDEVIHAYCGDTPVSGERQRMCKYISDIRENMQRAAPMAAQAYSELQSAASNVARNAMQPIAAPSGTPSTAPKTSYGAWLAALVVIVVLFALFSSGSDVRRS